MRDCNIYIDKDIDIDIDYCIKSKNFSDGKCEKSMCRDRKFELVGCEN